MTKTKIPACLVKRHVFYGKVLCTRSGLYTFDLVKNKAGKIVSRKKTTRGKMSPWIVACVCARKMLKSPDFVLFKKGSPLYLMAKELHSIFKKLCLADIECVSRKLGQSFLSASSRSSVLRTLANLSWPSAMAMQK